MAQRTPVVLNPNNKQHIPLGDTDTIRPTDIPVSPDSGNTVQVRSNGIYVGTEAVPEYAAQYVDAVNGNDTTGDGTKANPYKTVARAVNNMVPGTRGYTVYCHENQEHAVPSRILQGVSMSITSYPSLQDNMELLRRIQQAWFDKYGGLLTVYTIAGVFDMATLIPDRVNPISNTAPGGPYGYVTGLVMVNGALTLNSVKVACGKRDMDVPVTRMLRAAMLCDNDLVGPAAYNINYCEINLGSMPLLVQRGAGSNLTLNVYGTAITATEDDGGKPVYIKGWGSDAPRVTAMVGGISDGVPFVTVDGVDYRQRVTTGAVEAARDNTTGVVYHGDIPVTIDAAFLYKNG
mgnify:CR=1 FL=1|jgi:hypothetical protein